MAGFPPKEPHKTAASPARELRARRLELARVRGKRNSLRKLLRLTSGGISRRPALAARTEGTQVVKGVDSCAMTILPMHFDGVVSDWPNFI
jgi:hypothetical protein